MLHTPVEFPFVGALCFREHTAEPARILRHNLDETVLIERRERCLDGSTRPIIGASGNTTVPLAELFPDPELACQLPRRGRRSRRS